MIKYYLTYCDQMEQNFDCMICYELVRNPVETLCCGQLMCDSCSLDVLKKSQHCPNCRQALNTKPSVVMRRMVSTMKVNCNLCGRKVENKELEKHKTSCPKKIISCSTCQQKVMLSAMIEHMSEKHPEQLLEIVIGFHEGKYSKVKEEVKETGESVDWAGKVKNKRGDIAMLGKTGKYYCGQKVLVGKCSCCDGRCGPTNGENCDACMQLDIKKLNLEKGFLVNPEGHVCKLQAKSSTYFCGRNMGKKNCTAREPCRDCTRVTKSVNIHGRYKPSL